MDMRPLLLLAGLLAAAAAFAEAYRWVDEDGVVHYSDTPREGAEQVALPKSNVTTVRQYATPPADETGDAAEPEKPFKYESFTVAAPVAEETLWNIEGVLNVTLSLTPALQPGHQVRVYFDGQERMESGLSFQIDEVFRGTHNLQAEVIDETGKLMIRTQNNTFYVQQNRVVF